jgi:hypothetical protein
MNVQQETEKFLEACILKLLTGGYNFESKPSKASTEGKSLSEYVKVGSLGLVIRLQHTDRSILQDAVKWSNLGPRMKEKEPCSEEVCEVFEPLYRVLPLVACLDDKHMAVFDKMFGDYIDHVILNHV